MNKPLKKAAIALIATLLLAGCTSPNTEPEVSASSDQKQAGVLGVQMCVVNQTGAVAKVQWLTADNKEILPKDILRAGQRTCASGWRTSLAEDDVTVKITWPDRLAQVYTAWNASIGRPQVRVDASKQSAADACGIEMTGPEDADIGIAVVCSDGFDVNEKRLYEAYNYHETFLQRVNDSAANKEFVMTLTK